MVNMRDNRGPKGYYLNVKESEELTSTLARNKASFYPATRPPPVPQVFIEAGDRANENSTPTNKISKGLKRIGLRSNDQSSNHGPSKDVTRSKNGDNKGKLYQSMKRLGLRNRSKGSYKKSSGSYSTGPSINSFASKSTIKMRNVSAEATLSSSRRQEQQRSSSAARSRAEQEHLHYLHSRMEENASWCSVHDSLLHYFGANPFAAIIGSFCGAANYSDYMAERESAVIAEDKLKKPIDIVKRTRNLKLDQGAYESRDETQLQERG